MHLASASLTHLRAPFISAPILQGATGVIFCPENTVLTRQPEGTHWFQLNTEAEKPRCQGCMKVEEACMAQLYCTKCCVDFCPHHWNEWHEGKEFTPVPKGSGI